MGRPPKKPVQNGFTKGNTFSNGRALELKHKVRKRYSKKVCDVALKNSNCKSINELPGVNLRPLVWENDHLEGEEETNNDIVDLNLQQNSYKRAHAAHKKYCSTRKSTKHVPTLLMRKVANQGFGVTVQYSCQNCAFLSDKFNLFSTTSTGACVTNVQSAVAFSKSNIKPTDAEYLFNVMNVSCPSTKTFQKHFNEANQVSQSVLEESLSENRGFVRDYVSILSNEPVSKAPPPSETTSFISKSASDSSTASASAATASASTTTASASTDQNCPSIAVSFDGQYNRPVYHGYDGKATSVSEPVLEQETDLNLLVAYSVVSKKDGSYEQEKVSYIPNNG